MKKAITLLLALLLVLSMSIPALAAESGDIKVTYSQDTAAVVTVVDITWGSMEFNYNSGDTKVWDPEKLEYEIIPGKAEDASWSPVKEGGDTVTVTNHSNTGLEVTVTYTPAEETGVDGSVTNGAFTLATAEGTDKNNAPKDSAKLTLDNSSTPAQWVTDGATTIGNMTVTLKTVFFMDATTSTADELEIALLTALNAGTTDVSVTLAANADEEMFTAINNALIRSSAAEGSVNLTIAGAQVIPFEALGNGHPDPRNNTDPTALKTLNLPDAVTLEINALSLPTVQAVYVPKVTEWEIWGIWNAYDITTLVLTAPGTITADFFGLDTENIDLTLHKDKESEVTNGNQWCGETWKSISFAE